MKFLNKLSISTKLVTSYLLVGIITLLTISIILYSIFKETIINKTTNQLTSVNVLKKRYVEDFFLNTIRDIRDDEYQLTSFHSMNILHVLDNKQFINSNDSIYHSSRLAIYSNIIFMDSVGYILKRATNNPLSDSTLKLLLLQFQSVHTDSSNEIFFTDITNTHGIKQVQVVCAFKVQKAAVWGLYFINHSFINDIIETRTGMGKTGESYLVGNDFYMRSNSRFLKNELPSNIQVKTPATDRAFTNPQVQKDDIISDYRGVKVISVHSKINLPGIDWVLISEIDVDEAMAPIDKIRGYMTGVALFISLTLIIVTLFLVNKIVSPLKNLTQLVKNISIGKFDLPFQKQNFSGDEIGKIEDAIIHLQQRISDTASFADNIGKGDFSADYKAASSEDTLGNSILKMRAELIAAKQKEELLTKQRTSALIEGQEKERERLARELHDGLGQMLTAIRLRIGLLKEDSQSKKDIQKIIDDTIQELRKISNNVMPAVLIDFGLEAGLKTLADYSSKLYNIPVRLNYASFKHPQSPKNIFDIHVSLYRISQEAINNAIKHSNTSEIVINVIEDAKSIETLISDNGVGFDHCQLKEGKGLGNMDERAKLIDGRFKIDSSSKGTSISIFVPLVF